MHGFVYTELKDYVVAKLGADAWATLLRQAGLKGKAYVNYAEYPDTDAVQLVTAASEVTGLAPGVILEDFGAFLAPHLFRAYRPLIDPAWKTLEFLENAEATIHRVVRARNAHARPPVLRCRRISPSEVMVVYASPRRLCAVARGIVRGLAQHYREAVTVTESVCMAQGQPQCQIEVRRS